eukprot:TRINITY_DN21043_c0_g1_i1.p1 TRINITY_DN21043_c0_g1~~TRINITY_DN21043_c0_g1_i1.p1  ORF type:complete len:490 (+),score=152.03 TRINITY_DN21043_c0_g1_i1:1075-2544(+)
MALSRGICVCLLYTMAVSQDLPVKPIVINQPAECGTLTAEVALREEKLYTRNITRGPEGITVTTNWTQLPFPTDPPLTSVCDIRCDGNDLIALETGTYKLFFYRFSTEHHHFRAGWQSGMGQPVVLNLPLPSPEEGRTHWAISQRGYENEYFTDPAGNEHPSEIGCDGMMVLMRNNTLYLMDNWSLPDLFLFTIPLPVRNRLLVRSFVASAAQLMVLTSTGLVYTMIADFDIIGYDPILRYTYNVSHHGIYSKLPETALNRIVLPTSVWHQHPMVDLQGGAYKLSDQITIVQNGVGNDAREMRIAGVEVATQRVGYWTKPINATSWAQFVYADLGFELTSFVNNTGELDPVLVPSKDLAFEKGPQIELKNTTNSPGGTVTMHVADFQVSCPPANLTVTITGTDRSTVYNVPFQHRPQWPVSKDIPQLQGVFMLPEEWFDSPDPLQQAALVHLFGERNSSIIELDWIQYNSATQVLEVRAFEDGELWSFY